MIRVNLIQPVGTPADMAAGVSAPVGAQKQVLAFGGSTLICALLVGSTYLLWTHQIAKANRQLALERAEAARLARIQAENQKYQTELAAIQSHIGVIEKLNKNREDPKELMTALGMTVNHARGLYLVSVAGAGDGLKIHGRSDYVNSIADFITALKQAGPFGNVQLQRLFENDHNDRVSFTFDLTCVYKPLSGQVALAAGPHAALR
jgi:Tfp pilus assembly protein PilN